MLPIDNFVGQNHCLSRGHDREKGGGECHRNEYTPFSE